MGSKNTRNTSSKLHALSPEDAAVVLVWTLRNKALVDGSLVAVLLVSGALLIALDHMLTQTTTILSVALLLCAVGLHRLANRPLRRAIVILSSSEFISDQQRQHGTRKARLLFWSLVLGSLSIALFLLSPLADPIFVDLAL